MTNTISTTTGTATENIIKVYIMEADYIGNIFEEETDFIKDDFVITGNTRLKEYNIDNSFYAVVCSLITDIECCYNMEEETEIKELATDYNITVEQVKKVYDIIESVNYPETPENITDIINIISNKAYDYKIIKGYSQSDWNYVIYNTDIENCVNLIEAYYFGNYQDVKIIEGDEEYWTTILNDDVWNSSATDIIKCLGLPANTEIYITDGYTTAPNFKQIS